ncbi:MAG TPA: UDP-glucose 4-epimerase GalE, partial [Pseudonocardia sp.]
VLDEATLVATIRRHRVTGVVHLAGKKRVDESVLRPMFYHQQNVLGVKVLLRSMRCCGVNRIVFSSSCAVYGDAEGLAIDESAIPRPVSPYGRTKLTGEQLVQAAGVDSGMQWISLRYFNVAGAGTPALGDAAEVNLIPMTFRALAESRAPHIFGGDYPTPDGTCVRDYIHVSDVVDAHLAAVERLERGRVAAVYNVGRGSGVSVREIMTSIADVTGRRFDPLVVARRPGDPASVVASAGLIEAELGWTARLELSDIIRSAWAAWAAHDPAPQPECVVADG